jgi:hypothetical protein
MMPLDPIQQKQIMDLLILSLEGEAGSEDMQKLKEILDASSQARDYYLKAVVTAECIRKMDWEAKDFENETDGCEGFNMMLWKALADNEKMAPNVEIPSCLKKPEENEKTIEIQKARSRISKFSLYSLLLFSAAMILLIIYVTLVPNTANVEVATLTDTLNAQWAESSAPANKNARLMTNHIPLMLRKGYAEIVFDDNSKVVIEAPAEFQVLSYDQIKLTYGRLYATVPNESIGFIVSTPDSKIIDLGTEFGVQADINGTTELHVTKGKTLLTAIGQGEKSVLDVIAGQARKVVAGSSRVQAIPIQDNTFVRKIDSKTHFVWKGQPLSLADIVGGGKGFGSGVLNTGIDVFTGRVLTRLPDGDTHRGSAGYRPVPDNPYIDGVFIPGLDPDKTQITSSGLSAGPFPRTSGFLWGYIFNGASHEGIKPPRHDLQLDNTVFGTRDNPAITIHSNQGITFDLYKIRDNIPNLTIHAFRSLVGVSKTVQSQLQQEQGRSFDDFPEIKKVFDANCSKVEFWVFLDGKQVYHCQTSSADRASSIDIPITAGDRFLTLAVTESDDTHAYDWALFGRPELILESADNQPTIN